MRKKMHHSSTDGDGSHPLAGALTKTLGRRTFLKGALATAPLFIVGPTLLLPRKAATAKSFGPSTTTEAYMVPNAPGVEIVAILTVGDVIGDYRMVGIPDGLGAFRSRGNEFTVVMNHELGGTAGIVRAHGSQGAFVSQWTIHRQSLKVLHGRDFTQSQNDVYTWDPATNAYLQGTIVWQRLCSGDLAAEGAFFANDKGTKERIYLNGEEVTTTAGSPSVVVDQGRPWARIATGPNAGEVWQLPRLGKMAYENLVASPYPQEKTIVVLLDDSALSTAGVITNTVPSEVYVYIGKKEKTGHPIVQAGLTNGDFYGLKINVNGAPVTRKATILAWAPPLPALSTRANSVSTIFTTYPQ
jgi:hypothetical protein